MLIKVNAPEAVQAPNAETVTPLRADVGSRLMDLLQTIKTRRAVRAYDDRPVAQPDVEDLIAAAIAAPSAVNAQPWAFAVALGRERVAALGERAKESLLGNLPAFPRLAHMRPTLEDRNFNIFYGAPALVVIYATSADSQASEDCCLAGENLMLAARARDLGTCWIGFGRPWLNRTETKVELGIPADHVAVAPIIIGHPTAWPVPTGRNAPHIHWVG